MISGVDAATTTARAAADAADAADAVKHHHNFGRLIHGKNNFTLTANIALSTSLNTLSSAHQPSRCCWC